MNLIYYLTGSAGLCLLCIITLFTTIAGRQNILQKSDSLFLGFISIFLILTKMASFDAGMLNIDESIMLSGGRTLAFDPRAWISLDPTTSGPLNFLPSIVLIKLADWASYGELRLFYTVIFQIPTIFILFFTFKKVATPVLARIALIPLVLTFGFFYFVDLVHASSENFPMLFLTIVLSAIILLSFEYEVKRYHLILAGIACAASFYVKLQVTPIFLYLTAASFVLLFFVKKNQKDGFIFLVSFVLTHAIALFAIWLYGGFYDFVQSYIIGNLRYTTVNSSTPELIKTFLKSSIRSLLPLLLFGVLMPGIIMTILKRRLNPVELLYHSGFILTICITIYCIIKPGRYFLHYTLLLVVPMYSYMVWLLIKYNWTPGKLLIPISSLAIAFVFYINAKSANRAVENETQRLSDIINQKLVERLFSGRVPGDRMAVWGWGSYYNHAARLVMGTRDVHFDFQTSYKSDLGKYYRDRYLADLEINQPKWFLDLSLPGGLLTNEDCKLIHFPAIYDFVKANYHEVYKTNTEVLYQKNSDERSK